MTVDEAQRQLQFDIEDDHGTFLQLRLGQDPGPESILRLRLALRVLWKHWSSQPSLPYDVAYGAGVILHFQSEAIRNLRASGTAVRERLLTFEIPDLVQGAFDLLAGSIAELWDVRRKDLGE
jgi:hypothetical protein